ncbi:NERD domain-containing protein [Sporosarcina sp. ACRSL]|uniref:nuclease-related domain-containing protein n=1 Tax=Sporosarcina sp. ACRSL TaxID=2918215 RepID=UPI001EF45C2A|nr:nuclease-related domain-containing protein [Sporosarcina sp. ACRSL]MCG7344445.1 NERD domain-containing protein [Sporosarcina sp. ACRSL]
MAQLVKLLDYVSRYENDLTRYPTQYIRLKNSQWRRMKTQWEHGADLSDWRQIPEEPEERTEEGKWYSPLFRIFGNRKEQTDEIESIETDEKDQEEIDVFDFNPNIIYHPENEEQLRKLYLDQLFHFQLKWASSTMMEKSNLDAGFMRDSLLRSFTQQLPDSYLLFYYPILKVKKAPVELDILLITPIECLCITVLEGENAAAFIGDGDRFWTKKFGDQESKILNPLIGLNRMEKIVSGILAAKGIDFPVKKLVISRNGYIDYPGMPFDTEIIDRKTYTEWFTSLRNSTAPMKFNQFKAAQSILDMGQTTAVSRLFEEQVDQGQPDNNE